MFQEFSGNPVLEKRKKWIGCFQRISAVHGLFLFCLGFPFFLTTACFFKKRKNETLSYARFVNPFIGTGGHGHTFPGATRPFGMVQLSPDTRLEGWDGCSGYHYDDKKIFGFSHTHLSGTGVSDYGDILVLPFQGPVIWDKARYATPFRHETETAWAGYYAVTLERYKIRAELTATPRVGIHRYTCTDTARPLSLLLDLEHRDRVLDSWVRVVSDTEIVGFRRSASWSPDQHVYFCMRFNAPFFRTDWQINRKPARPDSAAARTPQLKLAFTFRPRLQPLVVRVGLSAVSAENARLNLEYEAPHSRFESYKTEAEEHWNKELSKIEIEGASAEERTLFYTAWYHCMIAPNLYCDVNGQYRGRDGKIHTAKGFRYYTVFSLWDTYRALHPLLALTHPEETQDWIHTFLTQYQQGGALPVWELASTETHCMIGYHAVPVILEAWLRGIRSFDAELALQAMVSAATDSSRGLDQYQKQGFITNDHEHESVSKTVEYSYDDWCIAQFARLLKKFRVYEKFRLRALNYRHLFDPETHFLRGKIQGFWYTPFDPKEVNNFYTEANAWQYAFAPVQDVEGLIHLHGGDSAFARFLERMFTDTGMTGRHQVDITGLIGQYAHGNEPSHHIPYLFNYCGRPWRTQALVHYIRKNFYRNAPDGLIGNEDCGQMSAWYVFSALGFYPVTPGSGFMALGTPLFSKVRIRLGSGRILEVMVPGYQPDRPYVHKVRLDGHVYHALWLGEDVFKYGGRLEFQVSDKPHFRTFSMEEMRPPQRKEEAGFVAVPGMGAQPNPFQDSTQLIIRHIQAKANIWVQVPGQDSFSLYGGPLHLKKAGFLEAYAEFAGYKSPTVQGWIAQIPKGRSIQILSTPHPMYKGSGPNMLIDSVMSPEIWQNGMWQSYFGQDFRAVVDLGSRQRLKFAGIHVLDYASAWILFPREVLIEGSLDGKKYRTLKIIKNPEPPQDLPARTRLMGGKVSGIWRYVRVTARNAGPLPAWHESHGQPAHLFIDEVLVY
ncbi:MAG: GH92 family glycosyl hydrolase [Flavobacteriales bacterium]|nr:GH92 family glycosyl hydrolase [Flavobacteriales bacterium]